ncbi:MAG: type 1 glutamine amidotransferase [Wenzhouxiangellaceae bacterium]|nr:type 1 glutamine amidotransferase [Wenzhouxiangellaceae bacterium]
MTGPDRGGQAAWWFTALAVWAGGGRPLRIRPKKPVPLEQLDGLIIGGGADVSPGLYGQQPHIAVSELTDRGVPRWRQALGIVLFPLLWLARRCLTKKQGGLDPARDDLEQGLIGAALERALPLFGICRGMQLINVALGGTLHQSLEGFYDEYPAIRSVLPRKQVVLAESSRLQNIIQRRQCYVNALHSQAIDQLGSGLRAVAHERNGVMQAYEASDYGWLIGVQWHPEYLPQHAEQRALFRDLVRQAAAGADR